MVIPEGLEPPTYRLGICRSILMSYGTTAGICISLPDFTSAPNRPCHSLSIQLARHSPPPAPPEMTGIFDKWPFSAHKPAHVVARTGPPPKSIARNYSMTTQDSNASGEAVTTSDAAFSDFALAEDLLRTLTREGLVEPTPIQRMSIPLLLEGNDLIGLAQTGTGKTAAFLLPMLTLLQNSPAVRAGQPPKALILAPTRELANQISTNVNRLARDLNIRHIAVFGGARYEGQIKALKRGVDIVVATPGRLMDLMDRGAFDPRGVQFLVLDEADHMLDLGFFEPIKEIVSALPDDRQTMLFSATMPPPIEQLGKQFLTEPERVKAPQTGITADKIAQHVTLMPESDKRDRLCDVLNQEDTGQCLIFVRTKRRADALAKFMQVRDFAVDALHGDMRQGLRQKVLRSFREGKLQALIATDVAARGIDIAGLSHVVNFDITDTPEAYVHRIGRTGRAGLGGLAISFCSPAEEARLAAIISVVGARVELFDPEGNPVTDFQAKPAPRKRSRNRPPRDKRDAKAPRRKPAEAARKAKSEGRTAQRKWNDDKWSPMSNDAADGDRRPRRPSRPAGQNGKWSRSDKPRSDKPWGDKKPRDGKSWDDKPRSKKPRDSKPWDDKPGGKPAGKPAGKPHGKPHGKSGGKFAGKPAGKGAASGKPNRTKGGAGGNPFGANPFAKADSAPAPRKQASKPAGGKPTGGKAKARTGGKAGGRAGGKPGGNGRLKRR